MSAKTAETAPQANVEKILANIGIRTFTPAEMRHVAEQVTNVIPQRIAGHKSFPTFLRPSPVDLSDFEDRETIALEIGGTNMRLGKAKVINGKIELDGAQTGRLTEIADGKIVDKTIFTDADDFFDHVFSALPGLEEMLQNNPSLPLSIVFSFPGQPVEKEGSLDCHVTGLTKGFNIPGITEGTFADHFNAYIKKIKANEKLPALPDNIVMAIFNDTPILQRENDNIGLVDGTGYNFAIRVQVRKLREIWGLYIGPEWQDDDYMLVNLEAGGIDQATRIIDGDYCGGIDMGLYINTGSLQSRIDEICDKDEKGKQLDERLAAGKYNGVQLQIALQKLQENGQIGFQVPALTDFKSAWKSETISAVLADNWENTPFVDAAVAEKNVIVQTCQIIRDRAAQVLASHLAGALQYMDEREITATAEGSFFWKTPGFREKVEAVLRETFGIENIDFHQTSADPNNPFGSIERGAAAGIYYFARQNITAENT